MNNKKECNPNHCSALRQSAESILRLELRLKEALDHIKEKELQECDYIIKIKKLEEQKAELIEALRLSNNCINHAREYLKNKTDFQDNGLYKLRVISNEDLIKNIT